MTATGRRLRLAAALLVLAAVLWGSVRGSDHDFPVGPFRMYATSGRPNGAVRTAGLEGVVDGVVLRVSAKELGLRRAELEGQYPRFERDPRLLAALARHYEREVGVALDELRLVQQVRRLDDRKQVDADPEILVLATWERDG